MQDQRLGVKWRNASSMTSSLPGVWSHRVVLKDSQMKFANLLHRYTLPNPGRESNAFDGVYKALILICAT